MSIVSNNQPGIFLYGLQAKFVIAQDGTKAVNTAAVLFPGRAVTLASSQVSEAAAASTLVYGLSNTNKNTFINDTRSATGEHGGAVASVFQKGLVILRKNTYLQSDDTEKVIKPFQDDVAYSTGTNLVIAAIGADADGQAEGYNGMLTAEGVPAAGSLVIGFVTIPPSATEPEMEAWIDCPKKA